MSRLLVGPERDVVDVDHLAPLLQLVQEVADLGLVGPPQGVRLGQDLGHPLQPLEQRRVAERELELGRVEDVEDDDLVAAVAEVLQAGEDPGDVVEQVGEDRHHAPLLEPLGQVVEDRARGPTSRAPG